jgi:polysaccharide biosynthesis/export protein
MNKKLPLLVMAMTLAVFFVAQGLCRGQAPVPPSYQIGPNDLLSIYVWKEPELTRDVVVTPDGKISFPLIGEIVAQGRTVTDLKKDISDKLEDFVTAPEVTVIVMESRSRIIYTIGQVARPGPYPAGPGHDSDPGAFRRRGIRGVGGHEEHLIIRREGGKETHIKFNYREFVGGGNLAQNILLKPGDTIVVP